MKLEAFVASLALGTVTLALGCATSVEPDGAPTFIDSGSTGSDVGADVSAKDTGSVVDSGAAKDSSTPKVDSGSPGTDTGSPGTDTGTTDDSGADTEIPDTDPGTDAGPPDTTPPTGCTMDSECTTPPFNCCDKDSGKCSIFWLIVCLPAS